MSVVSPTPHRGTALTLGNSEEHSTAEEPPDISHLHIEDQQKNGGNASHSSPASSIFSSSLDGASSHRLSFVDPKYFSNGGAYSPSIAESTGGSASDYDPEHEPDSPSSLSSWNSWAGGRRGDLADVEDLELDGISAEPELETVSELDEEQNTSNRPSPVGLDSDDDLHQSRQHSQPKFTRRRHYINNQPLSTHPHSTPLHSHFSPQAGGNGLSHASRHLLRAPPNLAARRRKGRLAELAEENNAAINVTKMPSEMEVDSPPSGSQTEDATSSDLIPPVIEMEIFGPPQIPVRSVSPSETIPIIPSPLCVCLTAEEQNTLDETPTLAMDGQDFKFDGKDPTFEDPTRAITPTPPSPSASHDTSYPATISTPPSSPPESPQLARKSSARYRRSSSPGRSKPKFPLRPCFKRRASTQATSKSEPLTSRDSSVERESIGRGGKVRFSPAPPQEIRTHSPVDYDRKACSISNRLSPEDLEELRSMKVQMGLLEAKCAALAACKSETRSDNDWTESESESESVMNASNSTLRPPEFDQSRKRADSVSSSSPSTFCGNRFAQRDQITPAEYLRMEREKERERVLRMAGIGTGVGFRYTGGNATRQNSHGQCEALGASSIISRFGLSKPPPPLPGMRISGNSHHSQGLVSPPASYQGGSSLYRPSSAPPVRGQDSGSSSAFPQSQDIDAYMSPEYEQRYSPPVHVSIDEHPRGRTMEKSNSRKGNAASSTSTDATLRDVDINQPNVPSLVRTCPSPPPSSSSSSSSRSPEQRLRIPRSPPSHAVEIAKPFRPSIQPWQQQRTEEGACTPTQNKHNSFPLPSPSFYDSSFPSTPTPSSCGGYDSPASEFCYESGSEYDLIG